MVARRLNEDMDADSSDRNLGFPAEAIVFALALVAVVILGIAAFAVGYLGTPGGVVTERFVDVGVGEPPVAVPPIEERPVPETIVASDPPETFPRRWVVFDFDGLRTDDGTLLIATRSSTRQVARDGLGGLAYLTDDGLWWLPAGGGNPVLVAPADEIDLNLVEVIPTHDGPVARVGWTETKYVDLVTGEVAFDGPEGRVRGETWWAPNGLLVRVIQAQVTLLPEGGIDDVIEPAHIALEADTGDILFDVVVGTETNPYVLIHDFDGRHLIVSRYPQEPADPLVEVFVIDLSCASCLQVFSAPLSAGVTLLGPDVFDWSGPVEVPELP